MLRKLQSLMIVMAVLGAMVFAVGCGEAAAVGQAESPFKDITIRFFCGGEEGDMFANVVYNGAKVAEKLMGCKVEYVFSGWSAEKMTGQLREAIAAKPDGIAMMGHPGEEALLPLFKEAQDAGIVITLVNVDLPELIAKTNCGYVGAYVDPFGYRLGKRAIEKFGIKKGDTVINIGNWGEPGLNKRVAAVGRAFEEAGCKQVKVKFPMEAVANTDLLQPQVAGAVAANPDVKLIAYSGGQFLGAAPYYMESIGKKLGEIKAIGFDITPQVIRGFEEGYVNLTMDQQPFYQGFLPIVSLCLSIKYGLTPITLDTGLGFVDETNYKEVAEWAKQGVR